MLTTLLGAAPSFAQDSSAVVANALRAAPTSIAENAAVMDWAGTTLREGTNDGSAFDAVRFVDGKVASPSGEATFSGSIKADDGGGELFGELTDSAGAEVWLVVRCHGPKDPEFMPDQINSFAGGCTPESSFDLGDGPNECQDVQVAIHPAAS